MANEITVGMSISYVNGDTRITMSPSAQKIPQITPGYDSFTQTVTTSAADITLSAITTPRVFGIVNTSTDGMVEIGKDVAAAFQPLCRIRPGGMMTGEIDDSITLQCKRSFSNIAITQNGVNDYHWDLTAFSFTSGGNTYYSAALSDQAFSSAYVITTATPGHWGIIAWQYDMTDGTVSTKAPGASMAYDTEALALAGLPSADTDNFIFAYATIQANDGATWTANTDDLTIPSDVQDINITYLVTDACSIQVLALEE